MAFDGLNITFTEEDAARIPDVLLRGTLCLMPLVRGGGLSRLAGLARIRRAGGFCGLDVWLMLWLYFASGSRTGLKRFWRVVQPHSRRIGAVAGRSKLASPPSLSRALSAVELELLRPVGDALLLATADCDAVLRHPAALTYDTRGDGWHCFNYDPTVTTLRHRALPVGDGGRVNPHWPHRDRLKWPHPHCTMWSPGIGPVGSTSQVVCRGTSAA